MAPRKKTPSRTATTKAATEKTTVKEQVVDDTKVEETKVPEAATEETKQEQVADVPETPTEETKQEQVADKEEVVAVEGVEDKSETQEDQPAHEETKPTSVTETETVKEALIKIDPAKERAERAKLRQQQLAAALNGVKALPDNIAMAKINGEAVEVKEESKSDEPRPAIFDQIDRVMLPFVEKMMPGIRSTEKEQGDLHHSVAMLIRALLIKGETDMKIGIPYLFGYYNRYSSSVFHPQNHHRGVGSMRGSEDDINFYRNVSRLFVDIADPKAAAKVLERTDVGHFKKLTMAINSPAAEKIAQNLGTVIARVKTPK